MRARIVRARIVRARIVRARIVRARIVRARIVRARIVRARPLVIHIPWDVIKPPFDHVWRDVDLTSGCGSR
nr:hypothetical protein [Catelliglobosispora koreensis]